MLKEAWHAIEEAHRINPKNLTIQNTHAFILFRNNIDIEKMDEIEVVKDTLDWTFDVIEKCINTDIRKTIHVITYSENAIDYRDKFKDIPEYSNEASKYLDIGYNYILDELKTNQFIAYKHKKKLYNLKSIIERFTGN